MGESGEHGSGSGETGAPEPAWERAEEEEGGHPVIATIIVVAFLLIGAFAGARPMPVGAGPEAIAYQLGLATGPVVVAAMLWGIAYAVTIRRSDRAAIGASLGVTMVVAVCIAAFSFLNAIGAGRAAERADQQAAVRQLEQVVRSDGTELADPGEGAGPLARLQSALINSMIRDSMSFRSSVEQAGLAQLVSFEGITRQSPVLGRCDAFRQLAAEARRYGGRLDAHAGAARAVGEEAARRGELDRAVVRDFEEGIHAGRANFDRQWRLSEDYVTGAGELCDILRRGRWVRERGSIAFTHNGDLNDANAIIADLQRIEREQEAIRAQGVRFVERVRQNQR